MDEFKPHYDANGVFLGVTLYATKYDASHPIAALWREHQRQQQIIVDIVRDVRSTVNGGDGTSNDARAVIAWSAARAIEGAL
jgi:hypothetical protein